MDFYIQTRGTESSIKICVGFIGVELSQLTSWDVLSDSQGCLTYKRCQKLGHHLVAVAMRLQPFFAIYFTYDIFLTRYIFSLLIFQI